MQHPISPYVYKIGFELHKGLRINNDNFWVNKSFNTVFGTVLIIVPEGPFETSMYGFRRDAGCWNKSQ